MSCENCAPVQAEHELFLDIFAVVFDVLTPAQFQEVRARLAERDRQLPKITRPSSV